MKKLFKWLLILILSGFGISIIFFILIDLITSPSNNRDWAIDQAILPYTEQKGDLITVHNIRNFSYASTTVYTPAYYDKTYDLSKLKKVYYIVEPFSGFKGSAHSFLSFEFDSNEFLAISVEIRKEKGETFSALKGLLNQYEIMYVAADERDVVKLRANYRKDLVYVYPVKTTQQKAQNLFLSIAARINKLKDKPEFYNTVMNNCTTNIAAHVNSISPKRAPWSLSYILPAYSDKYAYDLGLIDTDLPFEQARQTYLINDRSIKFANDPAYSIKIRETL